MVSKHLIQYISGAILLFGAWMVAAIAFMEPQREPINIACINAKDMTWNYCGGRYLQSKETCDNLMALEREACGE